MSGTGALSLPWTGVRGGQHVPISASAKVNIGVRSQFAGSHLSVPSDRPPRRPSRQLSPPSPAVCSSQPDALEPVLCTKTTLHPRGTHASLWGKAKAWLSRGGRTGLGFGAERRGRRRPRACPPTSLPVARTPGRCQWVGADVFLDDAENNPSAPWTVQTHTGLRSEGNPVK